MSYKYTLQEKYLTIVVEGKPFSLNASHPTFAAMRSAIRRKQWSRIPKLVNMAKAIVSASKGSVTVANGQVYYKGRMVNSTLTRRILQMLKEQKSVSHMLKFMDNLYKNPSQDCINELYEFLGRYKLPITDDGCFMAYKNVTKDYKDNHTQQFDNSMGQVLTMPRKDVDADRRLACSSGFHFCSLAYLRNFGSDGDHIMGIKINPADVVSIPEMDCGKGRTWRYEVVMELADRNPISTTEDAPVYLTSLLPVERNRKAMLAKVLEHPAIKRAIKRRKIKVANLRKATLGRLTKMYAKLPVVPPPPAQPLPDNPVFQARQEAGLTTKQVAQEMDIPVAVVDQTERFAKVGAPKVSIFRRAINAILGR